VVAKQAKRASFRMSIMAPEDQERGESSRGGKSWRNGQELKKAIGRLEHTEME